MGPLSRGGLHKAKIMGGRRPKRYGYNKLTHGKSEKWIAEDKAAIILKRIQNRLSTYKGYKVGADARV